MKIRIALAAAAFSLLGGGVAQAVDLPDVVGERTSGPSLHNPQVTWAGSAWKTIRL